MINVYHKLLRTQVDILDARFSAPRLRQLNVLKANNIVKPNSPPPQAFNLSLPALENATDIEISGLFTESVYLSTRLLFKELFDH